MSWVEVDGAGWGWMELGGAGWRWMELGRAGFSNARSLFESHLQYITQLRYQVNNETITTF